MSRRAAVFLYTFAGWTLFVWVVFIRNIAKDRTRTAGFKAVHITLAVISIAFAAGCVAVVRRARQHGGEAAARAPAAPAAAASAAAAPLDAAARGREPVQEGSRHMA